jgi:hypothetical protein
MSEGWSRRSTGKRAPGNPKRYGRLVTRPMAVTAVRPVYSNNTHPAARALLVGALFIIRVGAAAVASVGVDIFCVHPHIGFLLVF